MSELATKRRWVLSCFGILIAAYPVLAIGGLELRQRLPMWAGGSDYTELSLGHAINVDLWLHGLISDRSSYLQVTHPGLPLQLFSWVAYRCSAIIAGMGFSRDAIAVAIAVVKHPENYWISAQASGLIVLLLPLLFFAYAAARGRFRPSNLWVCPFAFCILTSPTYTFFGLTNETFALALSALVSAPYLLTESDRLGPWLTFCSGAACGVAYLNKMPYSTWTISSVLAIGVVAIATRMSFGRFIVLCSGLASGFIAGFLALGYSLLRWPGIEAMFRQHLAILFHSGRYGQGTDTVFSGQEVFAAIRLLVFERTFFTFFLAFSCTLLAWSCASAIRVITRSRDTSSILPRHSVPQLYVMAWSLLAIALGTSAVLKHFGEHYLTMVTCAAIPGLLVALDRKHWLVLGAAIAGANLLFVAYFRDWDHKFTQMEVDSAELSAAIQALPSVQGHRPYVLYDYRTPTLGSTQGFALACSSYGGWPTMLDQANSYAGFTASFYGGLGAVHGQWTTVTTSSWDYVCMDKALTKPGLTPSTVNWNGIEVVPVARTSGGLYIIGQRSHLVRTDSPPGFKKTVPRP